MKKSQLRKIIRESIKELMTEQSTNMDPNTGYPINFTGGVSPYPGSGPNGNTYRVTMNLCGSQGPTGGNSLSGCHTLNGGPTPVIGQAYKFTGGGQAASVLTVGETYEITQWVGSGTFVSGSAGQVGVACMVNPSGGYGEFDFVNSSCPSTNASGSLCPQCDSGNYTWGNQSNWQSTFSTNLANASWLNAPGQPCQFLNNKVTQWEGLQSGINNCVYSAYYNSLECKIKYVEAVLKPQYNC